MNLPRRSVSLFSALALAGVFSGCASDPKTAEARKAEKDEYVTVMTTGSNIPVRIKKSDLAEGKVAKGTLADSVSGEEFAKNLRPGRAVDSGK
ncbi:MAG: hypothetical protein HY302_05845 [Opitutae bacterium]|nr:hypothetical protein [Opitutae bacterium]